MAQNKNGPVWGLAVFMVLSGMFAFFWYRTYSDNQAMAMQLQTSQASERESKGIVSDQIAELNALKSLIGRAETEDTGVGESAGEDTISGGVKKLLRDEAADGSGTLDSLEYAVLEKSAENARNDWSATHRQNLLNQKARDLMETIVGKDGVILTHKEALVRAEQKLIEQEARHSEELQAREETIDTLRAEKRQIQSEFATYRTAKEREVEDLVADINLKRHSVVQLRKQLREKEDPSFSTPDGLVTTVDHNNERCYIDLGSADGLRVGVTFSVYQRKHSGVGRRSTDDIKGKIEVVDILGPHRAEARIVNNEAGVPVAAEDPIYSPIFQAGQAMEIAVAGRIALDGMNRDQFRRLVAANGAKITVEVDDEGRFTDGKGQEISSDEAASRISSRTRFLVLADLGDQEGSENEELQSIYDRIRENTSILTNEAENRGVYELGLATFLEHIGYSRKQLAWKPESPFGFPGKLTNGARSATVGGTVGRRQSSAAVSSLFTKRKRPPVVSSGAISEAYRSR